MDFGISLTGWWLRAEIIEDVAGGLTSRSSCMSEVFIRSITARYLSDLVEAIRRIDVFGLSHVAKVVSSALRSGRTVFVAGNGGSAATAVHMASDWSASAQAAGMHGNSTALCSNLSRITAIANDYGYDEIFSRQLDTLGRAGDVVVLLSVGGRSPNLLRAAEAARRKGIVSVAVVGDPGQLAVLCDHHVVFGDGDYGCAEDLHLTLNHIIVRALADGRPARVVHRVEPTESGMSTVRTR